MVQQLSYKSECADLEHSGHDDDDVQEGRLIEGVATWAGTIWNVPNTSVPFVYGRSAIERCQSALVHGANRIENIPDLSLVEGDFVASVATLRHLVLYVSPSSTYQIYYRTAGTSIRWSTNLNDIVDDVTDIDWQALACISWGSGFSPYQNIHVVNPGNYLCISSNGITKQMISREDQDCPIERNRPVKLAEYATMARELLLASTAEVVKNCRRVGLMLSGGIDSAVLAWCLRELGIDTHCYHSNYPDFPPADESDFAKEVANYLGLPLHFLNTRLCEISKHHFIDEKWRFAIPYNHPTYYAWIHIMSMAASDGCDMLMSGKLADTYFNGATRPSLLQKVTSAVPWQDRLSILYHGLPMIPWSVLPVRKKEDFEYHAEYRNIPEAQRQIFHYSREAKKVVLNLSASTAGTCLAPLSLNLHGFQASGMAYGAPYCSSKIRKFSKTIPYGYIDLPFAGQYIDKPILRSAFLGLLPERIVSRNYPLMGDGPAQQYCTINKEMLLTMFSPDSYLVQKGIIDHDKLLKLSNDRERWLSCSNTLLVNAMTELWLRTIHS